MPRSKRLNENRIFTVYSRTETALIVSNSLSNRKKLILSCIKTTRYVVSKE